MEFLTLNPDELAILFLQDAETKHDGGFQTLMIVLQELTNRETGEIALPLRILERIPRYAFDYGNGGWEDRLTGIFGRTLGANLGRRA